MVLDVPHLIESGGLLLVTAIIFAESGLLLGFFLPGDTLLFSAGFFAAQGKLPLPWLLLLVISAAIAGYYMGYHIGRKFGPRLFSKPNGLFFPSGIFAAFRRFLSKTRRQNDILIAFCAGGAYFCASRSRHGQHGPKAF